MYLAGNPNIKLSSCPGYESWRVPISPPTEWLYNRRSKWDSQTLLTLECGVTLSSFWVNTSEGRGGRGRVLFINVYYILNRSTIRNITLSSFCIECWIPSTWKEEISSILKWWYSVVTLSKSISLISRKRLLYLFLLYMLQV